MQIGSDGIKGTIQAVVSKAQQFGIIKAVPKKCNCEIKVSVSAKQLTIVVPERNIVVLMNVMDVVNALTAANGRHKQMTIQENFRNVMNKSKETEKNGK